MTPAEDSYTPAAEQQLDDLAGAPDAALYDAVLDAIDRVLDETEHARSASPPMTDAAGKRVLATVVLYEKDPRWFVFWAQRPAGAVILGVGALPRL